jgi:hypothetical protein
MRDMATVLRRVATFIKRLLMERAIDAEGIGGVGGEKLWES